MAGCMAGRIVTCKEVAPGVGGPGPGRRARRVEAAIGISVVVPNREYEAWFIAAADSLNGRRGFVRPPGGLPDAESVRGAKHEGATA